MGSLVLETFFYDFLYEVNQSTAYFRNLGFVIAASETKTLSSCMVYFQFYPIKLPSTVGLLTKFGANK